MPNLSSRELWSIMLATNLFCLSLSEPLRPRRLGATYAVPTWLPVKAQEINEPSAVLALGRIRRVLTYVPSLNTEIATSFWRTDKFARPSSPKLCFLHGADSNCLEWRYVAEKLGANGLDCTALDWWTGGWTDREPITRALTKSGGEIKPWTLVREHLDAFFQQQIFSDDIGGTDDDIILIGASLGGAVAIDYAAAHPDRVRALILIDAGGESYAAPSPAVVRALAPAVLAVKSFVAWVAAKVDGSEEGRINALHRTERGWAEAYSAYLASGSYSCQVGPPLIRTLAMPTLVLWGRDDPILPLGDAYAFQRDLGTQCAGVREVPGAGHSPHLEDPEVVAAHLCRFLEEIGVETGASEDGGVSRRQTFRDDRPPVG